MPKRRVSNARSRKAKVAKMEIDQVVSTEAEESGSSSSDNESGSGSGSDSDEFVFESLASNRSRRSIAGNKMQELIQQQKNKANTIVEMTEEHEAYKDFVEEENDKDFTAEVAMKSDSEVDSDFDEDEAPEEPEDAGEFELKSEKRANNALATDKMRKKRERMMKELASNLLVEDNIVDEKTHAKYLKEAKNVAVSNKEDLQRIEMELARQRNSALEAFKPKERVQRTDVIRVQRCVDKQGNLVSNTIVPDSEMRYWQPSELWLQRQATLPPKPPGFDEMPYERI